MSSGSLACIYRRAEAVLEACSSRGAPQLQDIFIAVGAVGDFHTVEDIWRLLWCCAIS
jgi:hypothetical protein